MDEAAGQVNALATLNIRGERSVTCRGDFDQHPSRGPLPPGAPPVCEIFRHYPDALERAARTDPVAPAKGERTRSTWWIAMSRRYGYGIFPRQSRREIHASRRSRR